MRAPSLHSSNDEMFGDQANRSDLRTPGCRRTSVLCDETLSERLERLYDEEIDGILRRRRLVRQQRRTRDQPMREWRDVGLRQHRPRECSA
ncbi:hypothetical protein [Nocardia transvalensis]|uniref:hypothetical protein n=1 Tax=Nocardia transvalensis TaxID=37333 RepID=UPI001895165A|nr:hypothetical protein [Nocardia transvalensis]MBF6331457.1 hypothetical protein [Nocardia transvalensis]